MSWSSIATIAMGYLVGRAIYELCDVVASVVMARLVRWLDEH